MLTATWCRHPIPRYCGGSAFHGAALCHVPSYRHGPQDHFGMWWCWEGPEHSPTCLRYPARCNALRPDIRVNAPCRERLCPAGDAEATHEGDGLALLSWCSSHSHWTCEIAGFQEPFFDEPRGQSFGWVYPPETSRTRLVRRQWVCTC